MDRSPHNSKRCSREIKAADKGQLSVSEEDGQFLRMLAASTGRKRALEIGAASGYSAIWIGMGLRDTGGTLVTIEYDPVRANEAAENIRRAGLDDIVRVVAGDAFQEIPKLAGTFDCIFVDAWKRDYIKFFEMTWPRLDKGGLFLGHNVINKKNEMTDFLDRIATHPDLYSSIVAPARRRHLDLLTSAGSGMRAAPHHRRPARPGRRAAGRGHGPFGRSHCGHRRTAGHARPCRPRSMATSIRRRRRRSRSGEPNARYLSQIAEVCGALHELSRKVLADEGTPIVLGGDHSVAAGSVAASRRSRGQRGKPLGLIWVDAHGDMNTPETSLSGNVHGMPLAALLGKGRRSARAPSAASRPKVRPANTVLVGIRNLDEREKTAVRESPACTSSR